jgi:hypothetical protein
LTVDKVATYLWIWDQLVSVPNFSWMVVILVRRHVPMLDNGGTGLTDPWSCTPSRKGYKRQDLGLVSVKLQASSLTAGEGYCRMDLERINYGQ